MFYFILNFQFSNNPAIHTKLEWERQTSDGYVLNKGKINHGESMWAVEQEFKSYATIEEQELLIRLNITSSSHPLGSHFMFHHMVNTAMSIYIS